ncbi:MAG: C2H2-type zinc finger protein [Ruthenibacterium sp.]
MSEIIGYIPAAQDAAEGSPTEFICPVCAKGYKTKDGLAKHVEKEHPDFTGTDGTPEGQPEP